MFPNQCVDATLLSGFQYLLTDCLKPRHKIQNCPGLKMIEQGFIPCFYNHRHLLGCCTYKINLRSSYRPLQGQIIPDIDLVAVLGMRIYAGSFLERQHATTLPKGFRHVYGYGQCCG